MTRKDAGLTLIEMLTALALTALLLTIGLPAFTATLQRTRVATAMHRVTADLAFARSTAIMRRAQVVVCPRTPDFGCRNDSDWSHGWMVFTDDDGNRQPDDDSHVLRAADPVTHGSVSIAATRRFLRYQRDGRSAHSNQTLRVCSSGLLAGTIVVNNLGRVRTARPARETPCPHG